MKQSPTPGGPASAASPAAVPAQRRKGERRPEPVLSEVYAHLSVDGLREYRRALTDEEHRVSYWRRILQARLDLVASGTTRRGVDHDRLTPLRTYDDAERIRRVLATVGSKSRRPARVGIVGASLLGSETADALTSLGHDVFLIGTAANPMTRQLGATIAAWLRARHAEHLAGVLDARVDSVSARGDHVVLALSDGTELTWTSSSKRWGSIQRWAGCATLR